MSLGGGIGAVIGGVLGYVLAPYTFGVSAVMGAYMGTSLGFAVGMMIDPLASDIKPPGASDLLQLPSNTIGTIIPDLLGTGKISGGQLLFYGKEFSVPQYAESGGKGGGGGGGQITGYKYYGWWGIGIGKGQADCLYTVFADDKLVWQGELNRPESGGSEVILLQGLEKDMGPMRFHFGTDDDELEAQDIADIGEILGDVTLVSPYRGLVWAFFGGCCYGEYNRLPTMSFVWRKSPVLAFNINNAIMIYDYNPIHAVWYILCEMLGLSTDWLHSGDFSDVADQLYNDGLGISILFGQQQDALSYLESINTHVDMLLRYGSDGKFHPKLIRNDYNTAMLPLIDESMLQEDPEFTRGSWIDTINEIKVQYSEIIGKPESWAFDFVPYDMCSDGEYFYICGFKLSDTNYICKVVKLKIATLELIDSVEYDYDPGVTQEAYLGIRYESGFVYLAGYGKLGTDGVALLHKRPVSDLSTLTWAYIYSAGGVNCLFQEPEVDSNFVYAVGNYGAENVLKVAVNKLTGAEVWERHVTGTSPVGLNLIGDFLYIFKHYSGFNCIEVVDKSNPDNYANYPTSYSLWDGGNLYRGTNDGAFIYVTGISPSFSDTQGLTMKIGIVNMLETWQYRRNTDVGGEDNSEKCVQDGDNIFTVGRTGTSLVDTMLEKLDMDGNLITSVRIEGKVFNYAIIELGDYIYLASSTGVEKRLKSTLETLEIGNPEVKVVDKIWGGEDWYGIPSDVYAVDQVKTYTLPLGEIYPGKDLQRILVLVTATKEVDVSVELTSPDGLWSQTENCYGPLNEASINVISLACDPRMGVSNYDANYLPSGNWTLKITANMASEIKIRWKCYYNGAPLF